MNFEIGKKLERIRNNEYIMAGLILAIILNIFFFPVIWGDKTLMLAVRDAPSIMPSGAYGDTVIGRVGRTPDPGAPAWFAEPYYKIIHTQYITERTLPLWNPNNAFGTPLAAAMQPQPFYPLSFILSISPTITAHDVFLILRLFVAGLFTYLYIRLFLTNIPALAGALAFMFSGYLIIYLNMPHLSVEVLLPAVFYVFELLLRNRDNRSIVTSSVVVFLAIVGGMPESTFLVLSYGYIYYLFRFMSDAILRDKWQKHLINIIAVNLLGFGLAAFLLLPFWELVNNSFNLHQYSHAKALSGLIHDDISNFKKIFLYFIPHAMGPNYTVYYWGIIPFFLAVLSIVTYFRISIRDSVAPINLLVVFFSISVVLLFMKHFGSPLINWIGALPFSSSVLYLKYQWPLVGFAIAVLAGIGLSALDSRIALRNALIPSIVIILIFAGFFYSWKPSLLKVRNWTFLTTAVIMILTCLYLLLFRRDKRGVSAAFIALLLLELFLNFIPGFYTSNKLPNEKHDPYKGAPFIDFIKDHNKDHSRVFGVESMLYPNWAAAFGISDVRLLDALLYNKYRDFIRNFLLEDAEKDAVSGDLSDRFTGAVDGKYRMATMSEKRFLQLSSIKYLISSSPYFSEITSKMIEQIKQNNLQVKYDKVSLTSFKIAGLSKKVLFQHPPSERLPYKTIISDNTNILRFAVGMNPESYTRKVCGDGVEFVLEIRKAGGSTEKLFSKYIDPKTNISDRKWHEYEIDLSRFAGQEIELLFTTAPGPKEDDKCDWAGWGDIEFVDSKPAFVKIYDREAKVYEFHDILPRAAVFYGVELIDDEQKTLYRLRDPSFDVFEKVLLSCSGCNVDEKALIEKINNLPPQKAEAARMTKYESQHVVIEADINRPGILMFNDSNYPGWRAYVDGQHTSLLRANHLFRGVVLDKGHHVVEFKYQPRSFRYGLLVSFIAFAAIIFLSSKGEKKSSRG